MKFLPVAVISLGFLSGCSLFNVHTNLDKENFTEYFKPSSVEIMEKNQLTDLNTVMLGTVEGESCQADDTQPQPNKTDAVTAMRRKVADMGGNTLVLGKCAEMPATTNCKASLVCFGQGYKVQSAQ